MTLKLKKGDRIIAKRTVEASETTKVVKGQEYVVRRIDEDGDPILESDPPSDLFGWRRAIFRRPKRKASIPDPSKSLGELKEAAREQLSIIYLVAAYLDEYGKKFYAKTLRDAANSLTAALAELEGT